jgi:hypothetical protein
MSSEKWSKIFDFKVLKVGNSHENAQKTHVKGDQGIRETGRRLSGNQGIRF